MRARNQEFTLSEVQEPPSVGLRTAPCIALTPYGITTTEEAGAIPTLGRTGLTTYRVVSFCRIGVKKELKS